MAEGRSRKRSGLAHLCAACGYSLSGLRQAWRETAVRHEAYLGAVHFLALFLLDVPWRAALPLTLLWLAVLVVELLNSAVEAVVDLASPDFHVLAGRAKDFGSAAVFLALTAFAVAWAVVLWKVVFA